MARKRARQDVVKPTTTGQQKALAGSKGKENSRGKEGAVPECNDPHPLVEKLNPPKKIRGKLVRSPLPGWMPDDLKEDWKYQFYPVDDSGEAIEQWFDVLIEGLTFASKMAKEKPERQRPRGVREIRTSRALVSYLIDLGRSGADLPDIKPSSKIGLLDQVEIAKELRQSAFTPPDSIHKDDLRLLRAVHELGGTSRAKAVTADQIAAEAVDPRATAGSIKHRMSSLATRRFVVSQTGRGGGYWLTKRGELLLNSNTV